jgi:hypothetical protein
MEAIPGSVVNNGNGNLPPKGNGRGPAAGEKPRGAAKPEKEVRGRKTADKQEAVIEPKALKEALPSLVKLKLAADEATRALNDRVKTVAKKSGFLAAVVRKVTVAKAGEGFEEEHRKAEQLELAFTEVAKA